MPAGYQDILVSDLDSLHGVARIIDVREPDEFDGELGHLKGAELVSLGELGSTASQWDRTKPLLLVCRSGNRSGQAATLLASLGFVDLANLSGGMLAVRLSEDAK